VSGCAGFLPQGHPGAQQALDDAQLDTSVKLYKLWLAAPSAARGRRRDQAGPGPVVELPVADVGQLGDCGATETSLAVRSPEA
jgi:hypothetical protein